MRNSTEYFFPVLELRILIQHVPAGFNLVASHIGVEGRLRRARLCLYWPRMSAEVKEHISTCETCRAYETKQAKETLMSHEVPQTTVII